MSSRKSPNVYATDHNEHRRVCITGIGPVTPIGIGKDEFWKNCKEGKSGIREISRFDTTKLPCKVAAEIDNFDPSEFITPKETRRMDRFSMFAVAATKMAIEDSGLKISRCSSERVGVSIGSAIGGISFAAEQNKVFEEKGIRQLSPFLAIRLFPGAASSQVSQMIGAHYVSMTPSTGCTSGADAIAIAYDAIVHDNADVMLAGAAESSLIETVIASFCVINALSTLNDEPEKACRPFDLTRDGFVMGEGACVIVLEEMNQALERGANIYAELRGYGYSSDAYHMVRPEPTGKNAGLAIEQVLRKANIKPADVHYINAHGTGTLLNDVAETRAIKQALGNHASNVAVSSTKAMTGHFVGGTGALEVGICSLALTDGYLPPTINYEKPDPDCDLDYVPNKGRKKDIDFALSNSFGFGGKNTIILMQKFAN